MSNIPQIERRRIEAELIGKLYMTLSEELGAEKALEMIGRATSRDAFETGRAFAAKAPGGEPSLEHFATMMDVWRAGGVLDFDNVRLEDGVWSFNMTRCGYAQMYREMGLPPELAYNVSCVRDAHLARGYSEHLRLERSSTIVEGAPVCDFRFIWT